MIAWLHVVIDVIDSYLGHIDALGWHRFLQENVEYLQPNVSPLGRVILQVRNLFDDLSIEALVGTKHGLIGVVKAELITAFEPDPFNTSFTPAHD